MNYLFVFLGAGLGGVARHGTGIFMARFSALSGFPVATFTVNIIGSLLMGLIIGFFTVRSGLPYGWRLFLTTGIMGGFTTYSAFSLETVLLIERGDYMMAFSYILSTVVLGVTALFAGLYLMRIL